MVLILHKRTPRSSKRDTLDPFARTSPMCDRILNEMYGFLGAYYSEIAIFKEQHALMLVKENGVERKERSREMPSLRVAEAVALKRECVARHATLLSLTLTFLSPVNKLAGSKRHKTSNQSNPQISPCPLAATTTASLGTCGRVSSTSLHHGPRDCLSVLRLPEGR